eukprot:338935_1
MKKYKIVMLLLCVAFVGGNAQDDASDAIAAIKTALDTLTGGDLSKEAGEEADNDLAKGLKLAVLAWAEEKAKNSPVTSKIKSLESAMSKAQTQLVGTDIAGDLDESYWYDQADKYAADAAGDCIFTTCKPNEKCVVGDVGNQDLEKCVCKEGFTGAECNDETDDVSIGDYDYDDEEITEPAVVGEGSGQVIAVNGKDSADSGNLGGANSEGNLGGGNSEEPAVVDKGSELDALPEENSNDLDAPEGDNSELDTGGQDKSEAIVEGEERSEAIVEGEESSGTFMTKNWPYLAAGGAAFVLVVVILVAVVCFKKDGGKSDGKAKDAKADGGKAKDAAKDAKADG